MIIMIMENQHLLSLPTQERSQATYEAILASAEHLLADHQFDEISLSAICGRANCTVGAFYHRFKNKEALLRHIEDRVFEAVDEQLRILSTWPKDLRGEALLREFISWVFDLYANSRGGLRALTLRAESDPELKERLAKRAQRAIVAGAQVLADRLKIRATQSTRSLEFALGTVRAVLRDQVLFGGVGGPDDSFSRDFLIEHLALQFAAYLRAEEAGS